MKKLFVVGVLAASGTGIYAAVEGGSPMKAIAVVIAVAAGIAVGLAIGSAAKQA